MTIGNGTKRNVGLASYCEPAFLSAIVQPQYLPEPVTGKHADTNFPPPLYGDGAVTYPCWCSKRTSAEAVYNVNFNFLNENLIFETKLILYYGI